MPRECTRTERIAAGNLCLARWVKDGVHPAVDLGCDNCRAVIMRVVDGGTMLPKVVDRIVDALLRKAVLSTTEDGQLCIWRNHTGREDEPALAVVCEGTGDDGEITAEDAPFLTDEQRGHLNGSVPRASGSVDDPQTVRAALAFALDVAAAISQERPNA